MHRRTGARAGRARALALLCAARCVDGAGARRRCTRAVGLAGLQSDYSHELHLAGRYSGAYVYDLTAKQALFSERATHAAPAGIGREAVHGDDGTRADGTVGDPRRRLCSAAGSIAAGGVWEGNLYLRGGGDPTFGSTAFIRGHYGGEGASVTALATELVKVDGIHEVVGSVVGDESYFDSLRGEPSSDYAPDPFLEGTLSGWPSTAARRAPRRGRTPRPLRRARSSGGRWRTTA